MLFEVIEDARRHVRASEGGGTRREVGRREAAEAPGAAAAAFIKKWKLIVETEGLRVPFFNKYTTHEHVPVLRTRRTLTDGPEWSHSIT